ncbi:DUF4340 domain-containing protein [Oceanibaculum indicum]|uniref:DUF4340 domain-containing protein n=1 Tax=Oceanibaculum indicum P24 TaxID=1207063 RepID=K2J579_9PROT|nr:DUF4340 domain-containing protein [Oceanibaculum indicum]EKE70173.1 hypothetical protein P24_15831 [Oceanibaculum indicum P24]
MTARGFWILFVVTLLAVGAAGHAAWQRHAAAIGSVSAEPVFPNLTDRLNEVAAIQLEDRRDSVTLVRAGEGWVVENAHNYPARGEAVRALLLALADMRIVEAKTERPEMFARLEVEPLDAEEARSRRVTVLDGAGKVLAELIVGKKRFGQGGQPDAHYVRRPDGGQAFLAESRLDPRTEAIDWLDRRIADVSRGRVKQVVIDHPEGGSLTVAKDSREGNEFRIVDLPEGMKVENQFTVNATAGTLDKLVFDAVMPAEGIALQEAVTRYTTFDGLAVTIGFAERDGKLWTRYTAAALPDAADEVKAEAAEINARAEGWAYRLADFKNEQLRRKLEDLAKKQEGSS